MSKEICYSCRHFGGLDMKAIPPLGGYLCLKQKQYIVDIPIECSLYSPIIPDEATCDHLNMEEIDGELYCPDCEFSYVTRY
jgi:hypothetical protein